MKAAVLRRSADRRHTLLDVAEHPAPTPRPDEALVAVVCCALCRTDLHLVEGELRPPRLPLVPGHQAVGKIVRPAADGGGPPAGARVGAFWLRRACGGCEFCRRGLENLCPEAQFNGFSADGGFAELMAAPARFLVPLPERFADEEAAPLLCGGVIGYRAFRLLGLDRPARIGLYGFGASAHLTLQVARAQGHEVFVFTRGEAHRRLALDLGAAWAGPADGPVPAPLDGAICFAPAGGLVPRALGALASGGTLALAGVTMTEIPPLDYDRLLYRERVLRSVANATRSDAADFLALAARLPLAPRIETAPLERIDDALSKLRESRVEGSLVVRIER